MPYQFIGRGDGPDWASIGQYLHCSIILWRNNLAPLLSMFDDTTGSDMDDIEESGDWMAWPRSGPFLTLMTNDLILFNSIGYYSVDDIIVCIYWYYSGDYSLWPCICMRPLAAEVTYYGYYSSMWWRTIPLRWPVLLTYEDIDVASIGYCLWS